jgi:aminoglycoside phosphotransferase (APT) family kinase protein
VDGARRRPERAAWPNFADVSQPAGAYPDAVPLPVPPAEADVDAALVRRLLVDQHPDLAGLALRRLGTGWDNAVFRLGRDLTVRVPRREQGARLLDTEIRWLPAISQRLGLATPVPVRVGHPGFGYPWRWTVCRLVPGRPVGCAALTGRHGLAAAEVLAGFLSALHVPAPSDAPRNPFRGVPLTRRSDSLDRALAALPARRRPAVRAAWQRAVAAPGPDGPPRWLHGDLHGFNVMSSRGRIVGVIDFGDLCAGDPATDLACAWLLLDAPGRRRLRGLLGGSDADWERGRGWALFLSAMLAAHDAPDHAVAGRRGLAELLGS